VQRPYYVCRQCSHGQCPIDVELDIVDRESSSCVRRMEAVMGSDRAFGQGCEPLKLLAGLEVTAKAIERAAEAIGTGIAHREEEEIARAKQPVLPIVTKQSIPKLCVQMDGTGVPVVAAETEMVPSGSGISPTATSQERFRSSIFIMPANISGNLRHCFSPMIPLAKSVG
jgi:hypothetical protein